MDEKGQTVAEYALIAALIAVGAIVALRTLGGAASNKLDSIKTELEKAQPVNQP